MINIYAISILTDPIHNLTVHWDDMLFGATILGIISHAVSSFPPSGNPYINWILGIVQFAVGQRQRALITLPNNSNASPKDNGK
jgi:hypothetical protein